MPFSKSFGPMMAALVRWVRALPSWFAIHNPVEELKNSQGGVFASVPPADTVGMGVSEAGNVFVPVGGIVGLSVAAGGRVGGSAVGVRVLSLPGVGVSVGTVAVGVPVAGGVTVLTPVVKIQLIRKIMRVESRTGTQGWLKRAPFDGFMISSRLSFGIMKRATHFIDLLRYILLSNLQGITSSGYPAKKFFKMGKSIFLVLINIYWIGLRVE
jgi:hypothetical protein